MSFLKLFKSMTIPVTQYGEPVLRQKGDPVADFNDELRSFARDMIETMHEEEGIGLAAQQVSKALQLFVMDLNVETGPAPFAYTLDGKTPPLELIMPMVVINPELEITGEEAAYDEGCLSFPGIRGDVVRRTHVKMTFQDLDGIRHELVADGLLARCILHEYDHLQGILFIDRMTPQVLRKIETRVKQLKRNSRKRARRGTSED